MSPIVAMGVPKATMGVRGPYGVLLFPIDSMGVPMGVPVSPIASMGVPKATMGGSESPIASMGVPKATMGVPMGVLLFPIDSMGVPKATMGVGGPYGGPSVPRWPYRPPWDPS